MPLSRDGTPKLTALPKTLIKANAGRYRVKPALGSEEAGRFPKRDGAMKAARRPESFPFDFFIFRVPRLGRDGNG